MRSTIATIGFFDGVHRGHRFLLDSLKKEAARRGLPSLVITFEEHPDLVLKGLDKPLLTTFEERRERLLGQGIDEVLPFHFADIHALTAEAFMRLMVERYGVRVLLMGYDHRFGSDGLTTREEFEAVAQPLGLELVFVEKNPEMEVSSTRIRSALMEGDIPAANDMLGYPYTLIGTVVHGKALGRTIGFPTANLSLPANKLVPAEGVYAVQVSNAKFHLSNSNAILNIGCPSPVTANGSSFPKGQGGVSPFTLEVHIPDFEGDLYGETLSLRLLRRLRSEQTFSSLDALQTQIRQDLLTLRSDLGG